MKGLFQPTIFANMHLSTAYLASNLTCRYYIFWLQALSFASLTGRWSPVCSDPGTSFVGVVTFFFPASRPPNPRTFWSTGLRLWGPEQHLSCCYLPELFYEKHLQDSQFGILVCTEVFFPRDAHDLQTQFAGWQSAVKGIRTTWLQGTQSPFLASALSSWAKQFVGSFNTNCWPSSIELLI